MTITISEKETTVIERILQLLRQEKVAFKIEKRASEPSINNADIVWDWDGCDNAAYQLSLPVWSKDWDSEADKVWDDALNH
jgi:hypothetical protein